tara:strand:- start:227 stop:340 length:114 start_codon:yes stop_codon:yes gene_type:complete
MVVLDKLSVLVVHPQLMLVVAVEEVILGQLQLKVVVV